jgi:hypothetical protein
MFIVNPDPYLLPTFRISPFATSFLSENEKLPFDNFADTYLDNKFNKKQWVYTINGRQAIEQALKNYNLNPTDVVTILTTSGNKYISSCVTSSIEKFCQWNRELSADTKIIFVNHEFGYPFQQMEKLLALNIPIIEDCCTTFFSNDDNNKLGKYGDYAIYSLPKFFPIQVGGILVANNSKLLPPTDLINDEQKQYIIPLYFGDQQMGAVAKDYFSDENFCSVENGSSINLWKLYNLLTGVNKSTYIDQFLDRAINAQELVLEIAKHKSGEKSSWYLV